MRRDVVQCPGSRPAPLMAGLNSRGASQIALTGGGDSPNPGNLIDEASEKSFPASDPPAWTHMRIGLPQGGPHCRHGPTC